MSVVTEYICDVCGKIEKEEKQLHTVMPYYPLSRPRGWGYLHLFRPTLPCPSQVASISMRPLELEMKTLCSLECLEKALTELQQKVGAWRTESDRLK